MVIGWVMPVDVGLLEGIAADELGCDLAGDRHDRCRVHHRVGQRRHQIRRAWSARRHADADLARSTSVALGRVTGRLFVPHQHVVDFVFRQRVVERHDRAAWIAEDHVDPLAHQCLAHDL